MTYELAEKVALVTGGASGIGAACVRLLVDEGAYVVIADLDEPGATRVSEEVGTDHTTAVRVDVRDPGSVEAMVKAAIGTYGRLDLAVNNAGIGGEQNATGEYSVEGWRQIIEVNLDGIFYCMRYEIPAMLGDGGGSIVNMSSILGIHGFRGAPAYVAAKHGIVGLTKTVALEYSGHGLRVNAVGPAFIDTPLLAQVSPDQRQALVQAHPIGRLGRPEEVAELTVFLLSPRSSYVTGSYHLVDGGYSAQ